MRHVARVRLFSLLVATFIEGGILRANVLVSTSISLSQFQIMPSAGSIQFLLPLISPPGCSSPNFCATTFAQAQDSLGGLQQQFNVADNGSTSATASTSLANANSAASAPNLTESASDGVNLNFIGAASTSAQGTLYATFEIVGTTSPVTLNIAAALAATQMLSTDSYGISASSEVIFSVVLDNGDIPIFYDNPLSIGSSSSISSPFSSTLTGSASSIAPNTKVSIVIQVDGEGGGNNTVPEPSTLFLSLGALIGLGLNARRRLAARR